MRLRKISTLFLIAVFAICSMLCLLKAAAPTSVEIDGTTTWESNRIFQLVRRMNFTQEPMVDDWKISVWPQYKFESFVRVNNLPTGISFTDRRAAHTYVNEYFLIWANDQQIEFVLAHEAGHLICECGTSKGDQAGEDRADAIARVLTGFSRPYLEH